MIYFTSDLHFCHDRGFIYVPRGFTSIEEHDEAIIQRWNEIVMPNDTIYVLGDLMLNNIDKGMENFQRLNGEVNIILGNHDSGARQSRYVERPQTTILGYSQMLKFDGYSFYLSHYPTLTANLSDDRHGLRRSVLNLFGHTHQTKNFYNDIPMMYHVGVDSHDCRLVSIDQIIADIEAEADKCEEML